jgi:hypothetical protein
MAALLLLASEAYAQQPGDCKVEDWRFYQAASFIVIEGTTTCATGRLNLRAYGPNSAYIGNASTFIRGHTFEAYIANAEAPSELSIKYAITE